MERLAGGRAGIQERRFGSGRLAVAVATLAVAVAGFGAEARACSCLPPDLARSYEESTDVVRVQIVSESSVGDKVRYTAHVVTRYKGELEPSAEVQIETRYSSAACGLGPQLRGDYLVTSRRNESGMLFATACGFSVRFSSLTQEELAFLEDRASPHR